MKCAARAARAAGSALPWLIACLHAPTWADPMRPLVLPPAASAPAATQAPPGAGAVERGARPKEADGAREPERLVAIRQNTGPDGASRWQALFGERWVKSGDKLDRYTVGAIDGNTVQLAEGKQRRTLHLLPPLMPASTSSGKPLAATTEPGGNPPLAAAPGLAGDNAPQTKTAALSSSKVNGLTTP